MGSSRFLLVKRMLVLVKIVDHEKRRRDIVQVTAQIISKEGMSAATTRHIAKMAQSSLGMLNWDVFGPFSTLIIFMVHIPFNK